MARRSTRIKLSKVWLGAFQNLDALAMTHFQHHYGKGENVVLFLAWLCEKLTVCQKNSLVNELRYI